MGAAAVPVIPLSSSSRGHPSLLPPTTPCFTTSLLFLLTFLLSPPIPYAPLLLPSAQIAKLETILPAKLQEQGLETSVVAKNERDQAAFFFDFISRMQASD